MVGNSVLAFWLVALLLIIVPGADWAFVLGVSVRGLSMPRAVGGIVVGYTAMTAVVAAGVGALVAGSPLGLTMLTVVGGLYLIWHGAVTLLRAPARINAARPATASGRSTLARGIGVSGLNPKGLLLFIVTVNLDRSGAAANILRRSSNVDGCEKSVASAHLLYNAVISKSCVRQTWLLIVQFSCVCGATTSMLICGSVAIGRVNH